MRLYTFYTETHRSLLDESLRSLKKTFEDTGVVIEKFPQYSETGAFHSSGWKLTMLDKLRYIQLALKDDEPFIHADCDIVYYRPFRRHIERLLSKSNLDLIFQSDSDGCACMGFFACKPSKKVLRLFTFASYMLEKDYFANDQLAVNALLRDPEFSDVSYGLLGHDAYSIWRQTGGRVWEPTIEVGPLPPSVYLCHLNYTVGVENKLQLLKQFNDVVRSSLPY
jgi:hypothetical protein